MESSALATIVKTLTGIHQTQHQALHELQTEQEQVHAEDQQVLWSLPQPVGNPSIAATATTAMPHVTHVKMGLQDDP